MEPLVSVVIPTYNRDGRFLKRAIDSVAAQTWKNTEIVVVDDNAPDSPMRRAVEAVMAAYPQAVYVQNPKNLGGSGARNAGVARASGQYITFLDDDDEYLPEKVGAQVRFMIEGGYDMSFEDSRSYDEATGRMVHFRSHGYLTSTDNDALLRAHLTRHLTPTNVYMYKKSAFAQIGGFEDAPMGQEFFLMLRSIESGMKIGYLRRADVKQHLHAQGRISQGGNKIKGEEALYAFKSRYFDRLRKEDVRYITFRHHVVMGVAYKRNRQMGRMALSMIKAICASPLDAAREGAGFLKNLGGE